MDDVPWSTNGVLLAPISNFDREYLYQVILNDVPAYSWRGLGPSSSVAQVEQCLSQGVLAQMAVLSQANGELLGLAQVGLADFRHGTAQFSCFLRSSAISRLWPLEGFVLFLNSVFQSQPIRKLYCEVPEANIAVFGSGLARLFSLEGSLSEHEWHNGCYRSVSFYGLTREKFYTNQLVGVLLRRARTR